MTPKLCIFPNFRLVLCGKGFQLFPKRVQLPTDVGQLQLSNLRPFGWKFLLIERHKSLNFGVSFHIQQTLSIFPLLMAPIPARRLAIFAFLRTSSALLYIYRGVRVKCESRDVYIYPVRSLKLLIWICGRPCVKGEAAMILLEIKNRIIEETLRHRFTRSEGKGGTYMHVSLTEQHACCYSSLP